MSLDRPEWCEDVSCSPLCQMETLGGGQCIGKLAVPVAHITPAANNMSRCHYDKVVRIVHSFAVNPADIIVEIYIGGESLRGLGLSLPSSIIDNLPRGE